MKTFHICFYPENGVNVTVGVNIQAENMETALAIFKIKYPYVDICYIHNKSI